MDLLILSTGIKPLNVRLDRHGNFVKVDSPDKKVQQSQAITIPSPRNCCDEVVHLADIKQPGAIG